MSMMLLVAGRSNPRSGRRRLVVGGARLTPAGDGFVPGFEGAVGVRWQAMKLKIWGGRDTGRFLGFADATMRVQGCDFGFMLQR